MKTIKVFCTEEGWMADFVDDAEVKEIFGSTVVPTPFTKYTNPKTVIAELQYRNPEHTVSLAMQTIWGPL